MIPGLVIFISPLPFGLPIVVVAAVILLGQSFWLRRRYLRLKKLTIDYPMLRCFFLRLEQQLRSQKIHKRQ